MAKVDAQFQEQMSVASATLNGVDRAERSGGDAGSGAGGGDRVTSAVGGGAEKNRDLAVMAASDGPKVYYGVSMALSCVCRSSERHHPMYVVSPAVYCSLAIFAAALPP